jgi:hypothetical protein
MSGTVTEEGPGNVEGAVVEVCAIDTETPVLYTATTAANGTYSIASVAVGTYDVWFRKAGTHVSAKTDDQAVVANTNKVVNKTLVQYGTVSGNITRTGGPIPVVGASVALYTVYPGAKTYEGITDGGADYTIANIAPGTYQVIISAALCDDKVILDYEILGDDDLTLSVLLETT